MAANWLISLSAARLSTHQKSLQNKLAIISCLLFPHILVTNVVASVPTDTSAWATNGPLRAQLIFSGLLVSK
jgi:hypothetical protein